jgi:hypothetical protein
LRRTAIGSQPTFRFALEAMNNRVAAERLANLRIHPPAAGGLADVVAWCGAVQAQDYAAATWAVALRTNGATRADVERAVDTGEILRTHVLRPTWHFVTPADIRWMLSLTAERVERALAYAYRFYELEPGLRNRATRTFERALSARPSLTRAELGAALAQARMTVKGVRLALLTVHAELRGVLCSGPWRGRQPTYALLEERAAGAPVDLTRDEALARLTSIYFRSHGPATMRDFAWWSSLTMADVRRGIDLSPLSSFTDGEVTYWTESQSDGPAGKRHPTTAHLLPIYDEYFVAYRDLAAVPRGQDGRAMLPQAIVVDGQVAGRWKVQRGTPGRIDLRLDRDLTVREQRALASAVEGYRCRCAAA